MGVQVHERSLPLNGAWHLQQTLSPLRRGVNDPSFVLTPQRAWWCGRLTEGEFLAVVSSVPSESRVTVHACGRGAEAFIESADQRLGLRDSPTSFDPVIDRVAAWQAALPGVRLTSTGVLIDALVPAVLEQRVMASDAFGAWQTLVTECGDMAPPTSAELAPPRPMYVPPTVSRWRAVPSWQWHRARVDPARSAAIMRVLRHADQLIADTNSNQPERVRQRLLSVPGIGEWTVAQVMARVFGDADAVPWGDYHLGRLVGWGLLGRVIELDQVQPLLEPWRPARYRLIRYMELTASCWPPRRGPRLAPEDHRRR